MDIKKVNKIVKELQLDYLEFVEYNLVEREKLLPITKERQICNIIYNLSVSEKVRKKLSVTEYSKIISQLINQIVK